MERVIRWMPFAVNCIDRICLFLAEKSPSAADRLDNAFYEAVNILYTFPEAGPIEPTLEKEEEAYRYLVVEHHYKIIYYVKGDCIEIVAAWDCRRDPYFLERMFHHRY